MKWQRKAVHKQHVLFKDKSDPSKIIKPRLDILRRQRTNIREANKKHDKSDTAIQYIFWSHCCVFCKIQIRMETCLLCLLDDDTNR